MEIEPDLYFSYQGNLEIGEFNSKGPNKLSVKLLLSNRPAI
jgi:hypothetical protein